MRRLSGGVRVGVVVALLAEADADAERRVALVRREPAELDPGTVDLDELEVALRIRERSFVARARLGLEPRLEPRAQRAASA